MSADIINVQYDIPGDDLSTAGEASSNVKKILNQLGIEPKIVKKTAISMYEAEINAVIHAKGGVAEIAVHPDRIIVVIRDNGPGIPNVELAMREGYTTAPDEVREMGFGAGMGLPNIQRYADKLEIDTKVGVGTTIYITIYIER